MKTPSLATGPEGGIRDRASLLALLGLATLALATFADYGVGWDEPGLRTYGRLLLDFYTSGLVDRRFAEFADLAYYGGAFELLWAALEPFVPGDPFLGRHLACALVGIAGVAATAAIARRIAGARAGLLAALLLALMPDWYGHMFINAKDIPFATAMALALWLACRLLEEWSRPRLSSVVGFGLATGAAVGVRVGGLAAPLALLLPLLLSVAARARDAGPGPALADVAPGLWRLLPSVPVAVLVTLLTWPWIGLGPDHLVEAIRHFASLDFPTPILFEGAVLPATEAPRRYLLVLLASKLPEIVLLGLAALVLFGGRGAWADPRLVAVATAAGWPILHAVLAAPTAFDGIRHHLFVLPPLAVLAAIGLDRLLGAASARLMLAALLLLGAGTAAARLVITHPYQYVAFNALAGGTAGAQGRFELDYWGTALRELARETAAALDREGLGRPGRPWLVAVCGEPGTVEPILPPWLALADEIDYADVLLTVLRPGCPAVPPDRRLAEVQRAGAVLAVAGIRSARLAAARAGAVATLPDKGSLP